ASIFSFFEKYFTERCQEAAKQSQAEADLYKTSGGVRSSAKNKETWHVSSVINLQNTVKNK
ncbi:MAG: hypothetical protein RR256_04770, partial [Bacteroidales bacterium]